MPSWAQALARSPARHKKIVLDARQPPVVIKGDVHTADILT
jgi:hypothetical protein